MAGVSDIADAQLANTLTDEAVLTPAAFAERASSANAPHQFSTTRSGMPSVFASLDHVFRMCADALAVMGVGEEDVVLNLNAPRPHLSGVAARGGANTLGATVKNDHFEDYERVIEAGYASDVTVMTSIPSMATDLADEIEGAFADPIELFPRLALGLFGGEPLHPPQRRALRDRWGLDRTREYYGSSEVGLIAVGDDESRRLVPLLNHLIIELELDDGIVDIRDITEPTTGSILLTDPNREAVRLIRYRQGDLVRVYPDDPIPRIEPIGRADDAINLDGALLHSNDLEAAAINAFGDHVSLHALVHDVDHPTSVTIYVADGERAQLSTFFDELWSKQPALAHAIGDDRHDRIKVSFVPTLTDTPVPAPDVEDDGIVTFESTSEAAGRR